MGDGNLEYRAGVRNISGYTVLYPNVRDEDSILMEATTPNPYAESATQLFPLGTKMIQGERVWRYCKNAATALNIAAPLQSAATVHAEMDDDIVVGATAAIGDYIVSLTSTTNLAAAPLSTTDGIAEGYLIVNDAAGEGQMYKIKSHALFSGTAKSLFTLYDPLTIALTTSSQVGLIQNPYANVVASKAVMTGMFVGVPLIAVTLSYYFWSQTGGPAPVLANAAVALGTSVVVGTTAATADPGAAATTEVIIGYPLTPGITPTEYFMVFLTGDR